MTSNPLGEAADVECLYQKAWRLKTLEGASDSTSNHSSLPSENTYTEGKGQAPWVNYLGMNQ